MLSHLTCTSFAAQVGTTFEVDLGAAGTVPLRLVSATPLADRAGAPATAAQRLLGFSLLFHSPADRPLSQGTFDVHHPTIGDFPLFLVPVGAGAGSIHYEAVFARLPS